MARAWRSCCRPLVNFQRNEVHGSCWIACRSDGGDADMSWHNWRSAGGFYGVQLGEMMIRGKFANCVCVPGRFLRFIARRAGISWWERWMLLQSGNGAMNVLKRTTLMKIETQLKIGTKPMKMLLRSPKIQKGCRMSFSRLGMAIYFTFTVVARNPWTRWQFRQAVLNTPLTTHWIFLGMLSWTMAISREKYGCDHRC